MVLVIQLLRRQQQSTSSLDLELSKSSDSSVTLSLPSQEFRRFEVVITERKLEMLNKICMFVTGAKLMDTEDVNCYMYMSICYSATMWSLYCLH